MLSKRPPVDIVVPVFNARQDVQKCVESVLKHSSIDFSLVIVDDRSTDHELIEYLDEVAAKNQSVELLRPESNGGFVQSANLGMKFSFDKGKKQGIARDVLLLNSDTIVSAEFLERLQNCVYSDQTTGIVSPFSNNATICSIPNFCRDNPLPSDMSIDEYAAIIAKASLLRRPELVTAVGFCFYIRSSVLKKIGFFDPVYGRGFGEENEYCELAKDAGFTIRLADDVFVAHTGKASFGAEGRALEHKNMKLLVARHPQYLEDVAEFCETNPLLEVQANANFFTKRAKAEQFPAILHIIHANPFSAAPGGSEHYVLDLVRGMAVPRALIAFPAERSIEVREVLFGNTDDSIPYTFPQQTMAEKVSYEHRETKETLSEIVRTLKVSIGHLHHFFNWPVDMWQVFAEEKIPYFATLHDFYPVCPSHNLFDFSTMSPCACDGSDAQTAKCLHAYAQAAHTSLNGTPASVREQHRAAFDKLLNASRGVIAPCRKVIELVRERVSIDFTAHVVPHGYDSRAIRGSSRIQNSERLRIGVLGNVNYPNKGAENYLEALRGTRLANIEWHFFGDVSGFNFENRVIQEASPAKVTFHGAYERGDIVGRLREEGIELVLMLPSCHETFSFTLSEALIAGIPVLALPMGSIKERLEEAGLEQCVCMSNAQVCERLLYFASCRQELSRLAGLVSKYRHRTIGECVEHMNRIYGDAVKVLREAREVVSLAEERQSFLRHFRNIQLAGVHSAPVVPQDRYRPVWWLPIWHRLGGFSKRFDEYIRDHYFRQRVRIVRSFPFQTLARLCALSPDAELVRERARFASFRANGKDPFLVLPEGRVKTEAVDCVRLRIRCETPRKARAQLFWTHRPDEGFSEAKSCRIPLKRTSKWQDVIVDLRTWIDRERWTAEEEVVALRLDPLDCEGIFELEDLTFAQFS